MWSIKITFIFLVLGGVSFSDSPLTQSLPVSENPSGASLTLDEKEEIVERHNYWRNKLDIPPLVWSDKLAAYAKTWAYELKQRGCKMQHRPQKGKWAQKYGENIYWSKGMQPSPTHVVDSWASERRYFNFETKKWNMKCGHYSQVIWKNTTEVGCAKVQCGSGEEIWVCNYNPAGNYLGQTPY